MFICINRRTCDCHSWPQLETFLSANLIQLSRRAAIPPYQFTHVSRILPAAKTLASMGWYSLLPPYLTVLETWIIRVAVCLDSHTGGGNLATLSPSLCVQADISYCQIFCAIVNISPWLLAILIDLFLYIFRQIWYWIPIWGGRAQGKTRPRAPSLRDAARRRTLSLASIVGGARPGRAYDEGFRRRHARSPSDKSLDEAIGEDPATPDSATTSAPVT